MTAAALKKKKKKRLSQKYVRRFLLTLPFNSAEIFLYTSCSPPAGSTRVPSSFQHLVTARAEMGWDDVAWRKLEQETQRSGKSQEKVEQCGRSPPRAEVLLHPRHVGLVLLPLLPLVLRHQRLRGDGGDADALRELVCASARQHHVRRLRLPVLCGVQKRAPFIVCTLKSRLTFRPSEPCVGKVTFSITARASVTGLAMFFTEDTAPQASVRPSMIMASSSTSPSMFRVAPWPAGKWCNQSLPAQEFLSGILMADGRKVSIKGGLEKLAGSWRNWESRESKALPWLAS